MSQKKIKQMRRQIRKELAGFKIDALREFVRFMYSQNFWNRVKFAMRILFKRVKM